MAKYAVNSRLSYARNSVVAENLRFRILPLLVAAGLCAQASANVTLVTTPIIKKIKS